MSNQTVSVPVTQPTQDSESDSLRRLATVDIPAERRRLKAIAEPTAQQVLTELAGTSLDLVEEVAKNTVDLRDWVYEYLQQLSEHMEALEERVDTVTAYGSETTITPEDGIVLSKLAVGCKVLASLLMQGPFPIEERDDEGKQKLAELIVLAEQAEKILADSTLSEDDDEDDEDDGDDDEDDDVGPS